MRKVFPFYNLKSNSNSGASPIIPGCLSQRYEDESTMSDSVKLGVKGFKGENHGLMFSLLTKRVTGGKRSLSVLLRRQYALA